MATALKMIAFILSLGLDTLIMSTSLGFVKAKSTLKIAMVFASAEAIMPLVGLFVGKGFGQLIGHWASLFGGIVLLIVAVGLIFFEDDDGEGAKHERGLVGWSLIVTALSISLDELAVGFSIGLIGIPVILTIILIAIQAFVFTFVGLTFGAKLKPYLGEWSEKLAGVVLGLLGIWILIEAIVTIMHQ